MVAQRSPTSWTYLIMAPLRPGPQGLPKQQADERCSMYFYGADGQRLNSTQTAILQTFTFSLFYKPAAVQSTFGAHLISKNAFFASVAADFPVALSLSTSLIPSIVLSNGGDFTADLTVTASTPAIVDMWNFVAASYDGTTLTLCHNDEIKTATGSITIGTNTVLPYTLGNCALDFGGGVNGVKYIGLIYDAKIHNAAASASTMLAIRQGLNWRTGLVVEWWRSRPNILQKTPRS
jgi:Concanavalin A-like lectin/glucanases superfamily